MPPFATRRSTMLGLGLCVAAVLAWIGSARAVASADSSTVQVSPSRLAFYASQDGSTPITSIISTVTISNTGTTPVNWTAVPSAPWMTFDQRQGSVGAGATATFTTGVDVTQGQVGPQQGTVTVYNTDTADSLGAVTVFLRICQHTCVSVDAATIGHTISPLLFGSQTDWLNSGNFLWNRAPSTTCNSTTQLGGAPATGLISLASTMGLRILRYPGGITGDFLNWSESVGSVLLRIPQIDPYLSSVFGPVKQCPVFGPDEFLSVASQLQTQTLFVANVGTGTAQGAANWLTYNVQRGVRPQFWEIGNENYLQGVPLGDPNGFPYAFAAAYQSPAQYASRFADYAEALHGVDPTVKVGAVLDPDKSSWNNAMLPLLNEPVDFMTTHILFPKWSCNLFNSDDSVFRTLLAAPILTTYQLQQLEQTVATNAVGANKNANLAITEYGSYFWCLDNARNQTLAAALYAGMDLQVFMRDPRIVIATHSNLTTPSFQSPLGISPQGTAFPNALYHVFRAYSQAAGGSLTATSVLGSPTYSSPGLEAFPPLPSVPSLDTIAVTGPEPGTLRLFVVNRSLTDNIPAHVAFDSVPGGVGSMTLVLVDAPNYNSQNTAANPNTVGTITYPVPAPVPSEFDLSFPAHSLFVFIVKGAQ